MPQINGGANCIAVICTILVLLLDNLRIITANVMLFFKLNLIKDYADCTLFFKGNFWMF